MFGRTRTTRWRALRADGTDAVDDFGRHRAMILTQTRTSRHRLLRERHDDGAFSPEVHVFHEWCAGWWHRWGDGRTVLSDRALELAAWRLLDAAGERWPSLAAIPDPAEAGALVAAVDQRAEGAGVELTDPELRSAVHALRAAVDRGGRGIRRTGALRGMQERLARGVGVPKVEALVVDDLVGLTPLEGAVLASLCRACSAQGADVVVTTPSGRDRGGAEVVALIGAEVPEGRRALRAFAGSAAVRQAAMALVETGEADLVVATADGLVEVAPWTEPSPPAPPDLADAYAEGLAVRAATAEEARAACGPVRVVCPPDPEAERRWVARDVAALVARGVDPRDCAVVAADPAALDAVAAALADHGVPHRVIGGVELARRPIGRAVRWVVTEAVDGFTVDGVCGLADLLGLTFDGVDPRDLRRWCTSAGVRRGRPEAWRERVSPWATRTRTATAEAVDQAIGAAASLAGTLAALAHDHTPDGWHRAVHETFVTLGLPDRAAALDGGLHGWAAAVAAIDRLARDLALVEPGVWPAAALREAADRALLRAMTDGAPSGRAEVPVLTLSQLGGPGAAHVRVVGLARGAMRMRAEVLAADELPAPDPEAAARTLVAALLREAFDPHAGELDLVLSWPATDAGGAPVPPANVLAELLELPTAAGRLGDLVVQHAPSTPPELAARSGQARHRALVWRDDAPPEVAVQRRVFHDRSGPVGARDGVLGAAAPAPPRSVSVTAVDTYLKCPARYWYGQVLGLSPPDPASPELEPRRRGIALHRILERLLRYRDLAPLAGEDPAVARAQLASVAADVLDEIEAGGGFDPLFQRYARARWLAGLTDGRPAGILRSWLDRELATAGPIPEAVEQPFDGLTVGPIRVRGVIDRIDRLPGGARLVTDYKTGAPPTRDEVARGLAFQPIAYAAWVSASTGGPVAAAYLSLSRPDAIRRTALAGHPTALDAVAQGTERSRALALDDDARDALVAKVAVAAEALVAGQFSPTGLPPEVAGCRRCPYRRICRLDPVRHGAGLAEEDGACG